MEPLLLDVSLQSRDTRALVQGIVDTWFSTLGLPFELEVDHEEKPVTTDWVTRWVDTTPRKITASYDTSYSTRISIHPNGIVKASKVAGITSAEQVMAKLGAIPFELASFASVYPSWYSWDDPYQGGEFYGGHYPLGWAAAFRGDGHRRLVSRRWLGTGPWRLMRGEPDITLVQFHDLNAKDTDARQQAAPGHARLGYSAQGGLIPHEPTYSHTIDGLYLPAEKRLKIVVYGRTISESEMLSAATARYFQALGPTKPLESIGYVFMEEADALAHLPSLWLRELECYCIQGGQEIRLDTTYQPPPAPIPDWVKSDFLQV